LRLAVLILLEAQLQHSIQLAVVLSLREIALQALRIMEMVGFVAE